MSGLIKPNHDLVLLEKISTHEGQIVLPESALKKEQTCIVVDVGPGRMSESGVWLKPTCEIGQRVWIVADESIGYKVKCGERNLILVNHLQILGTYPPITKPEVIATANRSETIEPSQNAPTDLVQPPAN